MSLNGAIRSLGEQTYLVTRTGPGTLERGRYTPGPVTTFTIVASKPQPLGGRELKDLPEGQRGDETLKVFSEVELRVRTTAGEPDVLTYRGEPWTVINAEHWQDDREEHWEVTITRGPPPRGVVP